MSTKIVNLSGSIKNNEQFVVGDGNYEIKIGANSNNSALNAPSPIEYILAGYAGCINAIGTLVASELNLNLKSLQVDIKGEINVDKFLGKSTKERAGFNSIEVLINPETDASPEEIKNWLTILEDRCPVGDNLKYETPIFLNLVQNITIEAV
jgi:uncharacterized OsmC-like protein